MFVHIFRKVLTEMTLVKLLLPAGLDGSVQLDDDVHLQATTHSRTRPADLERNVKQEAGTRKRIRQGVSSEQQSLSHRIQLLHQR